MNPPWDNEADPERTQPIVRQDYFITGWLVSFLRDTVVSLINLPAGSLEGTEGEQLFKKAKRLTCRK